MLSIFIFLHGKLLGRVTGTDAITFAWEVYLTLIQPETQGSVVATLNDFFLKLPWGHLILRKEVLLDMTAWVSNEQSAAQFLVLRFILHVMFQSAWLPVDTTSDNLSLLLTITLYFLESSTLYVSPPSSSFFRLFSYTSIFRSMCGLESDSDVLIDLVRKMSDMNWSILEPQSFSTIVSPKIAEFSHDPDLTISFDSKSLQAMLSLLMTATEFREANAGSDLHRSTEKMQIYVRYLVGLLGWVVEKGDAVVEKFPIPPAGLYGQQIRQLDEIAQRNQIPEAMFQHMLNDLASVMNYAVVGSKTLSNLWGELGKAITGSFIVSHFPIE